MANVTSLTNITELHIQAGRTGGQDAELWSALGTLSQLKSLGLGSKYRGAITIGATLHLR